MSDQQNSEQTKGGDLEPRESLLRNLPHLYEKEISPNLEKLLTMFTFTENSINVEKDAIPEEDNIGGGKQRINDFSKIG